MYFVKTLNRTKLELKQKMRQIKTYGHINFKSHQIGIETSEGGKWLSHHGCFKSHQIGIET